MLAEMKSNPRPFQTEGSNQWVLSPGDRSDAGANVRRMHENSMKYLSRVIDEHPMTPWAWLAKVELEEPLGWKWSEAAVPVARNTTQPNGNRPRFAPEEMERRRRQQERNQRREATRPNL